MCLYLETAQEAINVAWQHNDRHDNNSTSLSAYRMNPLDDP